MHFTGRIPNHIGIIMDGNGRWAELRGLPRIEGHRRGVERVREVIEIAGEIGVKVLTLYAFSLENWKRPVTEVKTLMRILEFYLKKELPQLMSKDVVFRTIGDIRRLPEELQGLIREVEGKTSSNSGLILNTALSYSGRDEILRAVKKILSSDISTEELNEEVFNSYLDTCSLPPPDLIIRTSGEMRISNFMLWQLAYSELYFTETLWPDFTKDELLLAIQAYQQRERRFGTISTRENAF